jgi:hypothetical protein
MVTTGNELMALNNVLNRGIIRQRFMPIADQAVEPLLFERIPPVPSMLVHRPSDQSPCGWSPAIGA